MIYKKTIFSGKCDFISDFRVRGHQNQARSRLRECKNTEFEWEFQGFVEAAVSRAVC